MKTWREPMSGNNIFMYKEGEPQFPFFHSFRFSRSAGSSLRMSVTTACPVDKPSICCQPLPFFIRIKMDHHMLDVVEPAFDPVVQFFRHPVRIGEAHVSVKGQLDLQIGIVSELP